MQYYRQTKTVTWLPTTEVGNIWISTGFEDYIQPEDVLKRTTPLGVDLQLLDEDQLDLFELINPALIDLRNDLRDKTNQIQYKNQAEQALDLIIDAYKFHCTNIPDNVSREDIIAKLDWFYEWLKGVEQTAKSNPK